MSFFFTVITIIALFVINPFLPNAYASIQCHRLFSESGLKTSAYYSVNQLVDPVLQENIIDAVKLGRNLIEEYGLEYPGENSHIPPTIIPQEIYEKFALKDIARALVQKIRKVEVLDHSRVIQLPGQKAVDLRSDSDIILFFPRSVIKKISTNGFLNQFLTGKTRGILNHRKRVVAEDALVDMGLGFSEEAKKFRPKSAFLNIRSRKKLGEKVTQLEAQYGEVAAVLNENMKDVSLWTSIDSLELGLARSLGIIKKSEPDLVDPLSPYRGTFDSGYIETVEKMDPKTSYYEAIIFGEIKAQDVAYFLVTSENDVSNLKKLGKPIFFLKTEFKFNRFIYSKGAQLFNP